MDASGTQCCAETDPAKPWASRGTWYSPNTAQTWVYTADSDRDQGWGWGGDYVAHYGHLLQ